VPAATPVTIPEPEPTDAVVGLLLLHVPAGVELLKVVVRPKHTFMFPVIGAGGGNTVNPTVVRQPVLVTVYVIVDVPGAIAVTMPAASIVATDVLLLTHVPPDVALLSVDVAPGHTAAVPAIAAGVGFTVISAYVLQPVASW
jgi:hypothetical protein